MAETTTASQTVTEVQHAPPAEGKPFPPLDPTTFAPQLVWLAITFVVLYVVMARVALPRIGGVIEARRDRIASDLDDAEQLKKQTEEAVASYEQALAEARARALGLAQEARETLNAEVDMERADVESRIAAKLAEAEARIQASKEAAMSNVNAIAAETAEAIVQQLTEAKVTKDELLAAVGNAVKS